jgi:hypothetical protein
MTTADPLLRDLILIGEPDDPKSIRLTTHEAPVLYPPWGTFQPAVVKRGMVTAQIGLDVQSLSVTWSKYSQARTVNTSTASPAQLAQLHFYDNKPVRIFRAFMAAPGDVMTYGCADWFGGRIDTVSVERNQLTFNLKSFLNVVTQKTPSTVIEATNTLAGTIAVTIPPGDASAPVFACYAGSTEDFIIADCLTPVANKIYSGNLFAGGYMIFLSGAGSTLAGFWAGIGQNGMFTDGHGNHHSEFEIYQTAPWPPTPTVDSFYVSMSAPINLGDPGSLPFPYVPSPQQSF